MTDDARDRRGLLDRYVVKFTVLFVLIGGLSGGLFFVGNQIAGLAAGLVLTGLVGIGLSLQTDRAVARVSKNVRAIDDSEGVVGLGQLPAVVDDAIGNTQQLRQRVSQLETERDELEATLEEHKTQSSRQAEQLEEFRAAMEQCAAGRLETRLDAVDELEDDIAADFNEMMDELEETVQHLKEFVGLVVRSSTQVTEGTEEVERASEEITDTIQQISMGASKQSDQLQSVNQEMERLSDNVTEIASLTSDVATSSKKTAQTGRDGRDAAQAAIAGMREIEEGATEATEAIETLREEMQAIDELVEFIGDVAQQTNMLALNANIEASRSSSGEESGEGFGVVAQEVKELADESQEAANTIEERIQTIQAETNTATEKVQDVGSRVSEHAESIERALQALDEIASYAEETHRGLQDIDAATEEQAKSTQEVVSLVDETATISDQTSDLTEDAAAATEEQTSTLSAVSQSANELTRKAARLQETLDMFDTTVDPGEGGLASAVDDDLSADPFEEVRATSPDDEVDPATFEFDETTESISAQRSPSDSDEPAQTATDGDGDVATTAGGGFELDLDAETMAGDELDGSQEATTTTAAEETTGTRFGTGIAAGTEDYEVGREAAERAFQALGGETAEFCQVFCSSEYEYETVLEGIRSVIGEESTLFGCSSSGEFTGSEQGEGSVTVALVDSPDMAFAAGIGTGLSEDVTAAVEEATESLPAALEEYPHRSALVLYDGLAGVGDEVGDAVRQALGEDVPIAGGGAGDDFKLEETHVFCGDVVAADAVAICVIGSNEPVAVAVDHGHTAISEPMTVTAADGATVLELDGEPAFDAWQAAVQSYLTEIGEGTIDFDAIEDGSLELLGVLTEFEFGIEDEATGEYAVRWPGLDLSKGGSLTFSVEIPEGTDLHVLHSPPDEQVQAAQDAARDAADQAAATGIAGGFVFESVCRSVILGETFEQSVAAVSGAFPADLVGLETYGQLCLADGQLGGFQNTSTVIVLLPE